MSLPKYKEYKESKAVWLTQIPSHWNLPPLYLRYQVELGKMLDTSRITGECLMPYLRNVDVQWGSINLENLPEMDVGPSEIARYTVQIGDLLVCEGGEVGRAAVVDSLLGPTAFQKALHRLRAARACEVPKYMFYVLCWAADAGVFTNNGQSTIAHLTGEQLRKYRLPCPPSDEQTAIAAFLDRETGKIDALINEQEQLIKLLAEKRQATIFHAVTRGLNPDAHTKDSGVPWLGEVPMHWQIIRIGALFREVNEPGNESLALLSVSIHDGVSDRELDEKELDRKVSRSDDRSKYKAVAPGDLTYNMMRAWQGAFGSVVVDGMVSPAYVVARPTKDFLTSHVECLLRTPSAVTEMKRHSRGVTDFRLRLYWEEFKTIQVALPPKTEQLEIAQVLEREASKLDLLKAEAKRAISLLKERRRILIAAAVTGAIDVREVMAQPGKPLEAMAA